MTRYKVPLASVRLNIAAATFCGLGAGVNLAEHAWVWFTVTSACAILNASLAMTWARAAR